MELTFDDVARLPMPGDNVAIASRRLEEGSRIRRGGSVFELDFTVLHGHRFAVEPIRTGEALLSWELPFGVATNDIFPGHYVCNDGMLEALSGRSGIEFALPARANFADRIESYALKEAEFQPGKQIDAVDASAAALTFEGFDRGQRGAGTRNYIVILGTSSRTASFARNLATRLHEQTSAQRAAVDGIVAVAHTEGGARATPNNRELLLRTLAGFCVHPNVGAVLAVDYGTEAVSNRHLQEYMQLHDYPIQKLPHAFMSIDAALEEKQRENEKLEDAVQGGGLFLGIPNMLIAEAKTAQGRALEGYTVGEIAARENKHPVDAFLDISLSEDLQTFFTSIPKETDTEAMREVINSPFVLPGLSDGGAHMKFLTTGRYPTDFISSLVRDKGLMDLEQAHWRLSGYSAMAAGFTDRGFLREGAPADIIVYDYDALRSLPPERLHDFPADDWRLAQKAEGYRLTIVNGEVTFEDGECTNASPGALLRHGQG